jgi:hypothetical protein
MNDAAKIKAKNILAQNTYVICAVAVILVSY